MKILRPDRLRTGDIVGIIAPAGPPNQENLERGILFLTELGLKVIMGKNVGKKNGYLAGSDQERLEDVHAMFMNPDVKAIFCARGGYGTGRIASQIDYEMIKNNPKIFWGYSDITFLHTSIRQETGLVTFHGPMLASDIGKEDPHPLSKEGFEQLFTEKSLCYNQQISPLETLVDGMASGPLIGGNLSLLVSTLGTRFEINTKGKLLLIEDINEEPHTVDRMLNQLFMAGKLSDVNGLLIGDFCNCESNQSESILLDEVFRHYAKLIHKPALKGFLIGHCNPNVSVPFGVMAKMSTFEKTLTVECGIG